MEYAMVAVPAAPVRRRPSHSREMVNQLLFGESVRIMKSKKKNWFRVQGLHDGYEGWMTGSQLLPVDEKIATARSLFVTTDMLSPVTLGDQKLNIPAGSSLPFFENGKGHLGEVEYSYNGHFFKLDEQQPSFELVQQLTSSWLNVPYLWGGRTPLGVDCSGFVQVIFKLMGIDMPRDAWQQAQEGRIVKKLSMAQPGDLAFFDDKEEIIHVGILLGNEKIIHASGKVRIDEIGKKGVEGLRPNRKILKLKAIRRMW